MIAFLLVIFSGLLHALWNLFAKKSVSKITFLWSIHMVSFFLLLPYFLWALPGLRLDGAAILLLLGSMLFQFFYVFSLIMGYSKGELSIVYPVLRGSASLIIPIASVLLFKETLTGWGWFGLLLIFCGILAISDIRLKMDRQVRLSILIAIGGGISVAGYTLSDKVLLQSMTPLMIIQFQNYFYSTSLIWGVAGSGKLKEEWKMNWKIILLGSLFVPGAYALFLYAMQLAQVAQLAPLREVSIVFGAILGMVFLKEKQGARRIVSSLIIVLGIIILGVFGS